MMIKCASRYDSQDRETVNPRELAEWLQQLPIDNPTLELVPVMHQKGNQRDPYEVFVGMIAKWEEDR